MINEELKKRLLSLLWRAGLAGVVAIITLIVKELPNLGLPEFITIMVILVLNEVTKWLNKTYQIGARILGKKS